WLALGFAFSSIAKSLRELRRTDPRLRHEADPRNPDTLVTRRIISPMFAAALLLSLSVRPVWKWIGELAENLGFGPDTAGLVSFRTIIDAVRAHFTLLSWPDFLVQATMIGGLLAWSASRMSA